MAQAVTVVGADRAASHLRAVGAAAHHQQPAMAAAAYRAARGISGVPVRTGRLAGSIEPLDTDDYGYVVGSRGVRYAPFVFRGTRHMAARPPRVPAGLGVDVAHGIGRSIAQGR
jgi:hypothetical protein